MNPLAPVTAIRPLIDRSTPCRHGTRQIDWPREESMGWSRAVPGFGGARNVVVHVPSVPTWPHDRIWSSDARRERLGRAASRTAADVQPSVLRMVHRHTATDARLDLSPGRDLLRLGRARRWMI